MAELISLNQENISDTNNSNDNYTNSSDSDTDSTSFVVGIASGFPLGIPNVVYQILQVNLHFSCISLILTILIYLLTSKDQSFHGWTQFSYIFALGVFYIIQCVVNDAPSLLLKEKNEFCFLLAITTSFFLMAVYTSLLSMNLDIFWIFRASTKETVSERRRFIIGQVIAWGIAAVDLSSGILLDWISTWDKRPRYGELLCRQSSWNGGHYICFIVVGLNLVIFLGTLFQVVIHYLSDQKISSTKSNDLSKKVNMFLKLCILMGLAWPSSLCAAIKLKFATSEIMKWIIFIFAVLGNLQGIVIFGIFVCNKRTVQLLRKRYPCIQKFTRGSMPTGITKQISPRKGFR